MYNFIYVKNIELLLEKNMYFMLPCDEPGKTEKKYDFILNKEHKTMYAFIIR